MKEKVETSKWLPTLLGIWVTFLDFRERLNQEAKSQRIMGQLGRSWYKSCASEEVYPWLLHFILSLYYRNGLSIFNLKVKKIWFKPAYRTWDSFELDQINFLKEWVGLTSHMTKGIRSAEVQLECHDQLFRFCRKKNKKSIQGRLSTFATLPNDKSM